jgi:hypothetical protein
MPATSLFKLRVRDIDNQTLHDMFILDDDLYSALESFKILYRGNYRILSTEDCGIAYFRENHPTITRRIK